MPLSSLTLKQLVRALQKKETTDAQMTLSVAGSQRLYATGNGSAAHAWVAAATWTVSRFSKTERTRFE
jgi:hypothetical protein